MVVNRFTGPARRLVEDGADFDAIIGRMAKHCSPMPSESIGITALDLDMEWSGSLRAVVG